MKSRIPYIYDEADALVIDAEEVEQASEDDLWFLPGPMEEECPSSYKMGHQSDLTIGGSGSVA